MRVMAFLQRVFTVMETVDPSQQNKSVEEGPLDGADVSYVETPSSLIVSQTHCGLKQNTPSVTLQRGSDNPPMSTPDAPTQVTPAGSPIQMAPTDTSAQMEVEEPGKDGGHVVNPCNDAHSSSKKLRAPCLDTHCNSCEPLAECRGEINGQTKVRLTKKERDALKLQRERLKAEARALKAEALALREEERLKKQESILKREQEKKVRRERREVEEKAKREKREARERERKERLEKKEMERVRKEELREEERRRKEEKRKLELEKQLSAEEKMRKQQKEQVMFAGFFSRCPKSETQMNDASKETKRELFDTTLFDQKIQYQVSSSSYLAECRERRLLNKTKASAQIQSNHSNCMEGDDVVIMSSPTVPPKPPMKLLQFHTNIRPAYFGSWTKQSKMISGRKPFKMDTSLLDYEFDSDEEWEEEEPGESVSSAGEGEDDSGEESAEEEEDGFFVPHGYLSEDEGERSESEGGPAGAEMDKVKAKAKAWEAEFQRTCQPKKVVSIGCVWTGMVEKTVEDDTFLSQFSALVLTEAPVRIELTTTSSQPESQGSASTDSLKRPVPEEAMPDLICMVHHNTAGLVKLIKTFQLHWGTVLQSRMGTNPGSKDLSLVGVSPQAVVARESECENTSRISKRQLEKKIQQIAVKEVRAPSTKSTWYVHDSIIQQYKINLTQLAPLLPATPKSQNSTEKSSSPEGPLATPVSKKGTKRKVTGTTPSVKALFEAIAKSPQNAATTTPKEKKLKLMPLPASEGIRKAASADGGSIEPPKKRIRLESLSLKSPQAGTTPQCVFPAGVRPNHEEVIVIGNTEMTASASSSVDMTGSSSSKPTVSVTPSCKVPTLRNALQPPSSNTLTQPAKCVGAGGNAKCLQELTNQQETEVSTGGGEVKEPKLYIDWQKLNKSSNSNKVTVVAEIH